MTNDTLKLASSKKREQLAHETGEIWPQAGRTLVSKQYSQNQTLSTAQLCFSSCWLYSQASSSHAMANGHLQLQVCLHGPKSAISVERVSNLEHANEDGWRGGIPSGGVPPNLNFGH